MAFQNFGIAEGGRVQDVKEMAKAAGQSFPGFTPPNGETQEQVRQLTGLSFLLYFNTNKQLTVVWL